MRARHILLVVVAAVVAVALSTVGAASAASPLGTYPGPCVWSYPLQTQGWDLGPDAKITPDDEHIHTGACFPLFGTIGSGTFSLDVQSLQHNNNGTMQWVRYSDGSTVLQRIDFPDIRPTPDGVGDYARIDTLTVDPSKFTNSGWREFRLTTNWDDPELDRWYDTTRWPINVQNGKSVSNYAGGPTVQGRCGAADNYLGVYHNVYIDCRDLSRAIRGVSGTVTFRVRGDGYNVVATVDPNFHASPVNLGQQSQTKPGGGVWQTVTFDTTRLANGEHKLHLRTHVRDSGHEFAGAFVFPLVVSN